MRINILLSLAVVVAVGCTKPNPNRCCIDEADCAAAGLPSGMSCADGRVCHANVCVEETCSSVADCDLSAPYCVGAPDGSCAMSCTADTECPGRGEGPSAHLCESGACVECRTAADCSAAAPACNAGLCAKCTANEQCASGVCNSAGTCAAATDIAYIDVAGSPSSECTQTSPCSTIERGMLQLPPRTYLLISPGIYSRTGPLVIGDRRFLIGRGTPLPAIDRDDNGPIITTQGSTELYLGHLQLSGATGAPGNEGSPLDGYGIYCKTSSGAPTVTLRDVTFTNDARGVGARQCRIDVAKSSFTNLTYALELTDVVARIDSNTFDGTYVSLDGGLYNVTNNVFARNVDGVSFYSAQAGSVIDFNTFVDSNLTCGALVATSFSNNIFARSGNPAAPMCSFPGSIIAPTDISALKFKKSDSAPYDYHLLPGSSAIDTALTSTLDHDIDGDARPKGAGRDVGADEVQ